jgi:hypothetical protein
MTANLGLIIFAGVLFLGLLAVLSRYVSLWLQAWVTHPHPADLAAADVPPPR